MEIRDLRAAGLSPREIAARPDEEGRTPAGKRRLPRSAAHPGVVGRIVRGIVMSRSRTSYSHECAICQAATEPQPV